MISPPRQTILFQKITYSHFIAQYFSNYINYGYYIVINSISYKIKNSNQILLSYSKSANASLRILKLSNSGKTLWVPSGNNKTYKGTLLRPYCSNALVMAES